jgi:hypothetical protein
MPDMQINKENINGKRILIFQQRGWGLRIGHYVAKSLQNNGAILSALTFKPSTDEFTRCQSDVNYEIIENHDVVMNDPGKSVGDSGSSLSDICDDLGINSLWPLAQSLRNHVRSYEEAFYYSYRQNVSDESITQYFQAAYKLCNSLLDRVQPDLIIAPNFVALPHIFMRYLARRRGIPMFAVTDTKVTGVLTFTHSHFDDEGPFIDQIDLLASGVSSGSLGKAREYLAANRKIMSRPTQMVAHAAQTSTYREIRTLISHVRHSMKNPDFMPLFGHTVDAPSIRMIFRDFVKKRLNMRAINRRKYVPLDDVKRFAFFPLQTQPEESIDVISPLFNNQIETLRQIAMNLPGDMTLVVKEHPAMAELRTPTYADKIARTPNVKLIDYRTATEKILGSAELIITSAGTIIFEAAISGIPVVQLGDQGTTRRLPNVVRHTDMSTIGDAIERALGINVDEAEYTAHLENYVAAAYDVGFELDYFGLWDGYNKQVRDHVVDHFVLEAAQCLNEN